MRRPIAICAVVALLIGCDGSGSQAGKSEAVPPVAAALSPAEASLAVVKFFNKTDRSVQTWAEWSYRGSPIWQVEHEKCVAAGQTWEPNVVYNEPSKGPQIRIYVKVMENSDCSSRLATRFVAFKELTFTNNRANFSAIVFHEPRAGYVLCFRGDTHPEACDASDGGIP